MTTIALTVDAQIHELEVEAVVVAGYTGRDRAAVEHHIEELAQIGVPRPPEVPQYWVFPPALLSQESRIVVSGEQTSGEVEACLVATGTEGWFLTVASDHTDRSVETTDVGLSKHVCPKPLGRSAWRLDDVEDHLDDLILRSWISGSENPDSEILYQEGTLGAVMPISDIIAGVPNSAPERIALWTGTVPTIGGLRQSRGFRAEIHDPVTEKTIGLAYEVAPLGHELTPRSKP